MLKRFGSAVLCILLTGCSKSLPATRDGDIIFHTSRSSQSLAIQKATHSPYSHVGIIFLSDSQPYVFEAAKTVRYTPLKQWIERGQGRHFVLKRLANADAVLTPAAVRRMRDEAQSLEGRPYDLTFEWSDEKIYCSELVWKIYQRATGLKIGELQALKDFDLTNPIVAAKLGERYHGKIPLDEPVISPAAMFESPILVTAASN